NCSLAHDGAAPDERRSRHSELQRRGRRRMLEAWTLLVYPWRANWSRNNSMTTQRERRARKMEEPKGHDFGVKVRSIVLGSMDFTGNLSKAQINGVAYGYMHEPSLRTTVPVLTLL